MSEESFHPSKKPRLESKYPLWLAITYEEGTSSMIGIDFGKTILGRGRFLRLDDKKLSRKQAEMEVKQENGQIKVKLTILGRSNTSIISYHGQEIQPLKYGETVEIHGGDRIYLRSKSIPIFVIFNQEMILHCYETHLQEFGKNIDADYTHILKETNQLKEELEKLKKEAITMKKKDKEEEITQEYFIDQYGRKLKWIGSPLKKKDGKIFYQQFQLEDEIFSVGDCVEITSPLKDPYIAEISELWHDQNLEGSFKGMIMKNKWFFRHSDTGTTGDRQEVFAGNEYDENEVVTIENKVWIDSPPVYKTKMKKYYYFSKWYDSKKDKFYSDNPKKKK